ASASAPAAISGNHVTGAYQGGSLGVFVSPNATSVADMSGPFQTSSINFGFGPIGLSLSKAVGKNAKGQPITVYGAGFTRLPGFGVGIDQSSYAATTTRPVAMPFSRRTGQNVRGVGHQRVFSTTPPAVSHGFSGVGPIPPGPPAQ